MELFVFYICLFLLYKFSENILVAASSNHNLRFERLMCEVEFIWDGVFLSKVRGFFIVARSPLPNYQIADLEEFCLKYLLCFKFLMCWQIV